MEKIMMISIAALFALMLANPSKPWVTPHDPGPAPVGITLENPVHSGGTTNTSLLR